MNQQIHNRLFWILVLVYSSVGLRVFDSCDEDGPRCPTGSKCVWMGCNGRRCICENNLLPSVNDSTCVKETPLGERCQAGSMCMGQPLSECRLNTNCTCLEGYKPSVNGKYCVQIMKGDVTVVEFGQFCDDEKFSCFPDDLRCSNQKCACEEGFRPATAEERYAEPYNIRYCRPESFELGKPVNVDGAECQKLEFSTTTRKVSTYTPSVSTIASTQSTTSTSTSPSTTSTSSTSSTTSTSTTSSTTSTTTTSSTTSTSTIASTTSTSTTPSTTPTTSTTASTTTPTTTVVTTKPTTLASTSTETLSTTTSTSTTTTTPTTTKATTKPSTAPTVTTTKSTTIEKTSSTPSSALTPTTTPSTTRNTTPATSGTPSAVTPTKGQTKSPSTSKPRTSSASTTKSINGTKAMTTSTTKPITVASNSSSPIPSMSPSISKQSPSSATKTTTSNPLSVSSTTYKPYLNSSTSSEVTGPDTTTAGIGDKCHNRKCQVHSECVMDACNVERCRCELGYANSPDEKSCWKLSALGEECRTERICHGQKTQCGEGGVCECETGYETSDSGRWCRLKTSWFIDFPVVGEECSGGFFSQCYMQFEQQCVNGKCKCKEGYRAIVDKQDMDAVYPDIVQCRNETYTAGKREEMLCLHQSRETREYDMYDRAKSKIRKIQGAIIGGCVGFVAMLGIVIGVVALVRWKRKGRLEVIRDSSSTASTDVTSRYSFKIPRPFAHFVGSKEYDSTQIAYPNPVFDKEEEQHAHSEPKPDVVNVGTLARENQNLQHTS